MASLFTRWQAQGGRGGAASALNYERDYEMRDGEGAKHVIELKAQKGKCKSQPDRADPGLCGGGAGVR